MVTVTTVTTSTTSAAVDYPYGRKSFYAQGLFWMFCASGTNIVYYTSPDNVTWTVGPQSPVRTCTLGYAFSVWFDGTNMCYAYGENTALYYRSGVPNSNGTISWNAAEQTVTTPNNTCSRVNITVDSNGYVWIGYFDNTATCAYVIKSGNLVSVGTWGSTPTGFPYKLSTSLFYYVVPVALTSGKMAVFYISSSGTLYLQSWSGSAWNAEIHTVSSLPSVAGYYFSVCANGDTVNVVLTKTSPYKIQHTIYTYSSNTFSAEVTVESGVTSTSAPVLSINSITGDLYCFWIGYPTANYIYYKKYTYASSTWDSSETAWITTETAVKYNYELVSFYQRYGAYIGLAYLTQASNPYNVRFAFLNLNEQNITHTATEKLGGVDVISRKCIRFRTMTEKLAGKDVIVHTPTWYITGVTRDSNGNPLGNCVVLLYKTSDNSYCGTVTSDSDGNYKISIPALNINYFLVSFKSGSPDVMGTTDNNITRS